MDHLRLDVERLALRHEAFDQRVALLDPQHDLARQHVDRLVLPVVVLEGQDVPRLDVEDLPDVAVGLRPNQLMPPRLLHAIRQLTHLCPSPQCGMANAKCGMSGLTPLGERPPPSIPHSALPIRHSVTQPMPASAATKMVK